MKQDDGNSRNSRDMAWLAGQRVSPRDLLVFVLGTAFALYVRYAFRGFVSDDFISFTSRWYAVVQQKGATALGSDVSNYNPPYLYLLYLTSLAIPHVSPVVAIKVPSAVFDVGCAWFVSRIVQLKYPAGPVPFFAFLAVLLAPTVLTNGSIWGQADSIYTSMLVACVYCLMTGRAAFATVAYGVALSFKLQAMFLTPALCALWLTRVVSFRDLLLAPAIYVIMLLPAWLAGRPVTDLLSIYFAQSVAFNRLSMNAPNMYVWLPQEHYRALVVAGLVLMACVGMLFVWAVCRSRVRIERNLILELSMLSLIMTPFFLPKMHDRFFYPADVLSIAYGFFFPKQYYVPVAISFASFFAYQPFLTGSRVVPLSLAAAVMALALISVARTVHRSLTASTSAVSTTATA